MELDLDQFIYALSDTVDLVGVDEIMHGKRVGCMAWKCARILTHDSEKKKKLFQLGLLHDCGVSSTREHRNIVDDLDWEDSFIHCRIGAERMKCFKPLHSFSEPVLHHHTRWEKLKLDEIDNQIKQDANLIYLLDRVDYLCQTLPGPDRPSKREAVRRKINSLKKTYFCPELVDVFLCASENEAFWFSLDPVMLMDFIEQKKKDRYQILIRDSQLITVARLFAQIVDAKSPLTAEHSSGVARVAAYLAEQSGLDPKTCLKIEVAGLLHDIGKLQIPDSILEKPGPLDNDEFSCMQHHSYVSYRILHKINGFEDIALWTANHHEALDGSGYPFHRKGEELDLESRIVIIADIFQALAQKRPYRDAQPLEKIINFLLENAQNGKLDDTLVEMVADTSRLCYQKAMADSKASA